MDDDNGLETMILHSNTVFNIDAPTVVRFLKRSKEKKSPGPDNISGEVL